MDKIESKLKKLDEFVNDFLKKNIDIMPMRFVKLIAYYYTDARVRKMYLRKLGVSMGENTYSNLGFQLTYNGLEDQVIIGNNVSIGPGLTCVTESSANNGKAINKIPYVANILTKAIPIIVEDEVWIGANVTILPGVKIGKCSVIGAGSVVTADVEPYSIYAGVPAKKIRCLEEGFSDKN